MCSCSAITDKVSDTSDERTKGEVDIANDVKWKTVISENDREEREVGKKLKEVCAAPTSGQPTGQANS